MSRNSIVQRFNLEVQLTYYHHSHGLLEKEKCSLAKVFWPKTDKGAVVQQASEEYQTKRQKIQTKESQFLESDAIHLEIPPRCLLFARGWSWRSINTTRWRVESRGSL